VDLVVVRRPDRGRDVVRVGVLEDEAAGAGLERRGDLLLLDEARQRDDLDLGIGSLDPGDRADPVELRHDDVHQDHVGRELADEVDTLEPVLGLADDLDVVEQLQVAAQPAADDAMVVDEHDADGRGLGHGSSLVRSNPPGFRPGTSSLDSARRCQPFRWGED
jgi:hypothetical protein